MTEYKLPEPVAYINHKAMMPPSLDSAATPGTLYSESLYTAEQMHAIRKEGYAAGLAAREGWKMVPVKATPAMCAAMQIAAIEILATYPSSDLSADELANQVNMRCWEAGMKAAPEPTK